MIVTAKSMMLSLDIGSCNAADLAMTTLHWVSDGADHARPFFGTSENVVLQIIAHGVIDHIR
jgi:hypothetical protein